MALRRNRFLRDISLFSLALMALGLLLSACSGNTSRPSLRDLLKLKPDRLTFVYFYTPG